jgi:hypothetical protein
MKECIGVFALTFLFIPFGYAQDSVGDKAQEVKSSAVQTKDAVAEDAREAGQEVKKATHKARRAVFTRCADGRHTIKGASGCDGHGGVSPQN